MARVRFLRVGLDVEVPRGTSILVAAQEVRAPEGSHCGGVCACSKCHVYVERGAELLSVMKQDERDMLDLAAEQLRDNSRLGCQARLVAEGMCEVRISEESFRTYLDKQPADRERVLGLWLQGDPSRKR